jgi:4'-phosphopantetheinyl transferase
VPDVDLGPIKLSLARLSRYERPQWLARAAALLTAAELERVAAIIDPDTRAQHAVGRALVRLLGARALGCRPQDVTVALTDTGKPWLLELPDLHVNVSHTRRAVVVASASVAPVGVDIEQSEPTAVHPQRLAQRLFARSEAQTLKTLSEERVADWFSSVWTIKEAVGKALGVGVIPALSQIVVETSDSGLELAAVGEGPPAESWSLHQLTAPGGSEKIAVAVPVPGVGLAPLSVVTLEQFARVSAIHGATART